MKNVKKLSLFVAIFFVLASILCINIFAEENESFIIDTNTVYAEIPQDFSFFPFNDRFYFINEEVGTISIFQTENFNLEIGVNGLTKEKAFDIYKYYSEIDTSYYNYEISKGQVEKVNGISSYVLLGDIISKYDECDELEDKSGNIVPGDICKQYFIVYIFATKENTIIAGYESSGEKIKEDIEAVKKIMGTVLVNGTYFDNDKLTIPHNFANSPSFEDALLTATENYNPIENMDTSFLGSAIGFFFIFFCGPVITFIIVAIVNIVSYSKNKKKLKRYELAYGDIPKYNPYHQNYGGYSYNPPVNHTYQPNVNQTYQQNPVNQNFNQTPSYVTNAVENLGEQFNQNQQPVQVNKADINQNNESTGGIK